MCCISLLLLAIFFFSLLLFLSSHCKFGKRWISENVVVYSFLISDKNFTFYSYRVMTVNEKNRCAQGLAVSSANQKIGICHC
jgi:hypothetical protein